MQGRKDYTEKLFTSFQLSSRVPKENLYRKLRETLDLRFLYKDTKELYGKTGNPSIDPIVFFKPEIEGFPYNKEKDEYRCPMDKPLPFKGFYTSLDGSVYRNYWAAPKECKACPMKSTCAPKIHYRKITRTVYDEQYMRAYNRQHSKRGKQMKKLRQSTVEPVFGSLTHYYGLRKIGVLGQAGAHKVMLMAAIAFNLKKYLRKGGRKSSQTFFEAIIDILRQHLIAISANPANQYKFS